VLYVDSDAYRQFYTHDASGHNFYLPDARVDDWAYFSKVQSFYMFGGRTTTMYIFLVANLELFPDLRTLAVSYQRLLEMNPLKLNTFYIAMLDLSGWVDTDGAMSPDLRSICLVSPGRFLVWRTSA
jgi:hypothetical protein